MTRSTLLLKLESELPFTFLLVLRLFDGQVMRSGMPSPDQKS